MIQRAEMAASLAILSSLLLAGCISAAATRAPATEIQVSTPMTASITVTPESSVSPSQTAPGSSISTRTITPTLAPTGTPSRLACWSAGGKVELGQLEIEGMREPLDYRVYLPPCYAEQTERHYPVLYLIHGQSYNDDQWDRLGVDETADRLVEVSELAPFLIVMPRDREWSQPDVDPFGEAVIQVLLPYIDETYRTQAERQFRAVGGLSRGASWAIHLGIRYWQFFGAIGGHSPPVFWADVPLIKRWLDEIPAQEMPRIFLDIGENDRPEIKNSAVWFEDLLTQRSIAHEWFMFSGYHDEVYWQAHVEQYLRWYAAEW